MFYILKCVFIYYIDKQTNTPPENKTTGAKTHIPTSPSEVLQMNVTCYWLLYPPTPGPWKGGQGFMGRKRGCRLRLPRGELIMNRESSLGGEAGACFLPRPSEGGSWKIREVSPGVCGNLDL